MRKIRLGMVGGGQGAFIGAVHRMAARLDGRFELVAGALSSSPEKATASALELGLMRSYADFAEMARTEAGLLDGIEAVAVVTPNHMHLAAAKPFLEAGIHVISDKPMTATLKEAEELARIASRSSARYFLTYTYSGYPMLREARRLALSGKLGDIRIVQAEYLQDWLTLPSTGKQAEWRNDPAKSGAGGAIADIGSHIAHLAGFVSGQTITEVSADLHRFVEGRNVDDNAHVLVRFKEGARGMLWASQVMPGHENEITIRVGGSLASVEWRQSDPNRLLFSEYGQPVRIMTRGGAGFHGSARVPGGHPEGYLEAFGSIYLDIADVISGSDCPSHLPGITEGLQGMRFIEAAIASSTVNGAWTRV